MNFLRWLWRHWYVPIFAIAGAIAFVVRLTKTPPSKQVQKELEAIEAGEHARLLAIDRGKARANRWIEVEYRATLERLNQRQAAKATRLASDPSARARWLTRLSRGKD